MLIQLKNINKTYMSKAGVTFRALNNVSLGFDNTGMVFLVGRSGSGKSTLMHVMGGLDSADSGEIIIADKRMSAMTPSEIDAYRNTLVGFVFQEFNLIESLSVTDNIKMALDMQARPDDGAVQNALAKMGIEDKGGFKVSALSGGQRQRVALARAIVKDPRIILADEPTGSLDSATGEDVMRLLKEMSNDRLVVIVTHDAEMANKYGDRIIELSDGRIYKDIKARCIAEPTERHDVRFIRESLIEANEPLDQTDVDKLNSILSDSVKKSYINFETDDRKVRALFPNLKEAVNEYDDKSDFVPYTPSNESAPEITYKKSRLPFLNALKLGLHNLWIKKGRLILTVIIAVISFAMFGVSGAFSDYDRTGGIKKTLANEKISVVNLYSSGDVVKLNETQLTIASDKVYGFKFAGFSAGPIGSADGFVETDDAGKYGKFKYGDGNLDDFESIVVTEALAREFLRNRLTNVGTMDKLVGSVVKLNNNNFKIQGILEYDLQKLDDYYNSAYTFMINIECLKGANKIIVKKGFHEHFKDNYADSAYADIKLETGIREVAIKNAKLGYSDDGLKISRNLLGEVADSFTDSFNSSDDKRLTITDNNSGLTSYISKTDTVTLIDEQDLLLLPKSIADEVYKNTVYAVGQSVKVNRKRDINRLIDFAQDNGLTVAHECVSDYEMLSQVQNILQYVLLTMSLALALLIVLLLYNFIATSIRLTKKQIGILRSLGARKADTFSIYVLEGAAVIVIALILTFIAFAALMPLINLVVSKAYGYYFAFIVVGFKQYLTVTLLAAAVGIASVLIPLRKFNKITPIDAITDK